MKAPVQTSAEPWGNCGAPVPRESAVYSEKERASVWLKKPSPFESCREGLELLGKTGADCVERP